MDFLGFLWPRAKAASQTLSINSMANLCSANVKIIYINFRLETTKSTLKKNERSRYCFYDDFFLIFLFYYKIYQVYIVVSR